MTPILLLHGALGAKQQLDQMKKKLEAKGLRVFSFNFSGHGDENFKNSFGISTFTEDLKNFITDNQIGRVNIFGYSMGGYVALWFAGLFPDRVNAIMTLGTKFDWSRESAEKEVKKLNVEKILEKVPAFARILENRHSDWKELTKKTTSMMLELGERPLLQDETVLNIQTPTLVCLGDQDDMADRSCSERVASLLPNGRFLLFENTQHPIEKVDVGFLISVLLNFLANPKKT